MQTSIFELFKIGIGPSSSHTVGPMRAAREFAAGLEKAGVLAGTARVLCELYGSLALTGRGHGTDRAILLGLCGEVPDLVDPAQVDARVADILANHALPLLGVRTIAFQTSDLLFHGAKSLPGHPNAMRFTAFDAAGTVLQTAVYFSIGGGFIQKEGDAGPGSQSRPEVPYPFTSGDAMLELGQKHALPIWAMMLENEKAWRPEAEVRAHVRKIWGVMRECVQRGLVTGGILPGGLNVRRRAPHWYQKLQREGSSDPLAPMDWVNVFAIAVNEENAAGGRVVTAPTNGAAGVIPAVAHYYTKFVAARFGGGACCVTF